MNSASDLAFSPKGETLTLTNPRLLDRGDYDLWNDRMCLHLDHRGRGNGYFLQPNPTPYAGNGRWFYVQEDGQPLWSLPFGPVHADPEKFAFEVSPDHLAWRVEQNGWEASLRVELPREGLVERWELQIRNTAATARKLRVTPAFPMGFFGLLDQQARYEAEFGGIVSRFFPYYVAIDDYAKLARRRNISYVLVDREPESWCAVQSRFLGFGDWSQPEQLRHPQLDCTPLRYAEGIAAFDYHPTLSPNEAFTLTLLCGPAADDDEVRSVRERFLKPEAGPALREERKVWKADYPAPLQIETPDPAFDAYINHWLPDRVLRVGRTLRFNPSPQARNALQDAMAASLMDPVSSRKWFVQLWEHQRPDGFLPHGLPMYPEAEIMPITKIPHKDSGVWAAPAILCYLHETGDFSILDEVRPFADGEQASVYEHVNRALGWLLKDRTARGLSRIGQGDWNDPLNMAGPEEKGESVWLTEALAHSLDEWAEVAKHRGDSTWASICQRESEACRAAIRELAWDGAWFRRATTDAGRWLGSADCPEGRIFLNAQSWALISRTASAGQLRQMRASVADHLETPAGPELLAPAFPGMRTDVGKITLKTPGTGENGSVYCHAVVFWAYGLYGYGGSDEAWRNLRRLLPGGTGGHPIEAAGQLPLYIPNFYRGSQFPEVAGQSSHSPNTGTSAWYLRTVSEGLFGFRPDLKGLRITPQLPGEWSHARVTRRIRGSTFHVSIERTEGVTAIEVFHDGERVPHGWIPWPHPGAEIHLRVRLPLTNPV
jgi:cellobionic acid phosphorylase